MEDSPIIESKLPYGTELKSFLKQSQISASFVSKTLRQRGIFFGRKDKSDTIPILCLTLLTPSQFESLQEQKFQKEGSLKKKSVILKWNSDKDLLETTPDINVHDICKQEYESYTIQGDPKFTPVENDRNDLIFSYEITRHDLDDNWAGVDKKFEANIRVTKRGRNIDVRVTNNFTSKETEEINNKIINYAKHHYMKSGYIQAEEKKITFGAFENSERILFLWSLTGNISDGEITFECITDIDIHPDTSKTFPKDLNIEWMANNISRVHLTGDQLHQTFFIKDKCCYPYLILCKMQVKYAFKTKSAEGSCNVSFEFQNYSKSKKDCAELVISIDAISLAKGYKHLNKKRIETDILQRLDDLKTSNFLTHLESSKS